MNIFSRKKPAVPSDNAVILQTARRSELPQPCQYGMEFYELSLYDKLRYNVPIIDAAISKIVRLTGGYKVICSDESLQTILDDFVENISIGMSGKSLHTFTDSYLDSLLTYGNSIGEILIDKNTSQIIGLYNGNIKEIEVRQGKTPIECNYYIRQEDGENTLLPNPHLILFSALNPPCGQVYGHSILRGLPIFSSILMRIYECIGQNYDRVGNVRYAVTYKPSSDGLDRNYAKERAVQIAREWSDGMNASRNGEIRDFVAVGDVDIKVIGAENQLIDTNIPVRQITEQLVSKLSIPPFLLGLNWSTTERMSAQQSDILTSELEYYRRIITPIIKQVTTSFLRTIGSTASVSVQWDNINLQDEVELADARLKNAQAKEIEMRIENN